MTRDDLAYCGELMKDANDVLKELRPDHFERHEAVNWADLRCVSVERVEEFFGNPEDLVTSWRVLIEEASENATEFRQAVSLGLVHRGHVGINVITEW